MKVVDCFPFFAPYGEEILYLRVNLLKDVVDNFIIVESNKTHNGKPVERKFLEIARQQGLPMEKIIYIEHDIPETEDLEITKLDRMNAGHNAENLDSLYARVRERLQKDAVMEALDQFDDNDVFIYGDADEIIKPQNVRWVANLAHQHQNIILKIPLVYLQGRADLRVHNTTDGSPTMWWQAMFFATKNQIMKTSVNRLRCGAVHWPIRWPTHDNQVIHDMGWHFAWMGNHEQRKTKATSFAHAHDAFGFTNGNEFSEYWEKTTHAPAEGKTAPDGDTTHFMKRYPISELPQLLLDTPFVRDFLLPEVKLEDDFKFNECKCYWCQKLDFPLLYNLDGRGEQYWFEIPRCASVTIKKAFPDAKQVRRDDDEYDEVKSMPIAIWRDPVDRFISTANAYLSKDQRYYHYGKDAFEAFAVNLDECTKEEKIDLFFRNLHKIVSMHQVHHFYPQSFFVDTARFKRIKLVEQDKIREFFGINKKYNTTGYVFDKEDLSDEQIEFIKRIYKSDYEFYEKYSKYK